MHWIQGDRVERGVPELGPGLVLSQTADGRPFINTLGGEGGSDTLSMNAQQLSSSATGVVARVFVADAAPTEDLLVEYEFNGLGAGGVTPASGQTIPLASLTTDLATTGYIDFAIDAPDAGTGKGQVTFRASSATRAPVLRQYDVLPRDSTNSTLLELWPEVFSTGPTTVVVRVHVADPILTGDAVVNYTYIGLGPAGITEASGRSIPLVQLTSDLATTGYLAFTIDLPQFGAGQGQVTFTAVVAGKPNAVQQFTVPTRDRDTVALLLTATQIAQDVLNLTVRVLVTDPLPGNDVVLAYVRSTNITALNLGTPLTITAASVAAGTGYRDYIIARPSLSAGQGQVVFIASSAGRAGATATVNVVETLTSTVNLQTLATITSANSSSVTVLVTAIDPLGTATVTIGAPVKQNVPGTILGTNPYTIPRNFAGTGGGRVTFTATAPSRISDSDSVDIPEIGAALALLQTSAQLTGTTPTLVQVRVYVCDTAPGVAIQLGYGVKFPTGSGGAMVVPSNPANGIIPAISVTTQLSTTGFVDYSILRPGFGFGSGQVTFNASGSQRVGDSDTIEIPEVGRDTISLACRLSGQASTATSITVRVYVADPFPTAGSNVSLVFSVVGGAVCTPGPAGTTQTIFAASITPNLATTGYVEYVIVRPAFGSATSRVTFTATCANRVTDSDSVDVQAVERDTVPLAIKLQRMLLSSTSLEVRVYVSSPLAFEPGIAVRLDYVMDGVPACDITTGRTMIVWRSIRSYVVPDISGGPWDPAFTGRAALVSAVAAGASVMTVSGGTGAFVEGDQFTLGGNFAGAGAGTVWHQVVGGPYPFTTGTATNVAFTPVIEAGGWAAGSGINLKVAYLRYTFTLPVFGHPEGTVTFTANAPGHAPASAVIHIPAGPANPGSDWPSYHPTYTYNG